MKISALFMALCLVSLFGYGQSDKNVKPALPTFAGVQDIRDFALSSSRQEAYITVQSRFSEVSVLVQIKKVNNVWSMPKLLSFSGQYNDLEPFLSKDDLTLYFASNRPVSDSTNQPKDFDIWYVKREDLTAEWGEPINLGAPINTVHDEFYPSVAKNNNLYFTSNRPNSKGKDDIFFSTWKMGLYSEPVSLSDSINTDGYEFNAYISPDESFIIFSGYGRKDGFGSGDLYISFQDNNQNWSKAINLGKDINSKYMDYCPFFDTRTNTLYFTSKRSSFKSQYDFQNIEDALHEINKAENGLSKIYLIPFNVSNKPK